MRHQLGMESQIFQLILERQRGRGRYIRRLTENGIFLEHQPHIFIGFQHLHEGREAAFAIAAIIIKELDNGDRRIIRSHGEIGGVAIEIVGVADQCLGALARRAVFHIGLHIIQRLFQLVGIADEKIFNLLIDELFILSAQCRGRPAYK